MANWGPNLQAAVAWSGSHEFLEFHECLTVILTCIHVLSFFIFRSRRTFTKLRGSAPTTVFAAPKKPDKPSLESPVLGANLSFCLERPGLSGRCGRLPE